MKDSLAFQTGQPAGGSVVKLSELPVLCLPVEPMMHLCKDISQLQHGYTLRRTVEMCGCAAPSGGLKALGSPAQRGALFRNVPEVTLCSASQKVRDRSILENSCGQAALV